MSAHQVDTTELTGFPYSSSQTEMLTISVFERICVSTQSSVLLGLARRDFCRHHIGVVLR
jgi:hypothetical protein